RDPGERLTFSEVMSTSTSKGGPTFAYPDLDAPEQPAAAAPVAEKKRPRVVVWGGGLAAAAVVALGGMAMTNSDGRPQSRAMAPPAAPAEGMAGRTPGAAEDVAQQGVAAAAIGSTGGGGSWNAEAGQAAPVVAAPAPAAPEPTAAAAEAADPSTEEAEVAA